MATWSNELELRNLIEGELYTAVVGDILDGMGYYHQFLPQAIRPMRETMRVVGRAMPVLMMDVFGKQEEPFGLMTQALDQLESGEVYVAAGAYHRSANWGEIMTAIAKQRGATGAVLNGFHRDTGKVLGQGFSVFSRGAFAQDSGPRMKVAAYRVTIEIEGVLVRPGDLIFGDIDGVVVVPKEMVDDVMPLALEKARSENVVRGEIENGMPSTDAFRKYGVL